MRCTILLCRYCSGFFVVQSEDIFEVMYLEYETDCIGTVVTRNHVWIDYFRTQLFVKLINYLPSQGFTIMQVKV